MDAQEPKRRALEFLNDQNMSLANCCAELETPAMRAQFVQFWLQGCLAQAAQAFACAQGHTEPLQDDELQGWMLQICEELAGGVLRTYRAAHQ